MTGNLKTERSRRANKRRGEKERAVKGYVGRSGCFYGRNHEVIRKRDLDVDGGGGVGSREEEKYDGEYIRAYDSTSDSIGTESSVS